MRFFLFWVTVFFLVAIVVWGAVIDDKLLVGIALLVLAVTIVGTIISDLNKR